MAFRTAFIRTFKIKRNPVKMITAATLSLSLAASTAGMVFAVQTDTLTGQNDVVSMVTSVVVPTDLDFTVDPFEISTEGGNQITHTDYFFINRTGVPVKVSMNILAELSEGAELVDDPAVLGKDDDSATDKRFYFAIMGADALEAGDLEFSTTLSHNAEGIYDPSQDTMIPFDAETQTAAVEFVLDAATVSMEVSDEVVTGYPEPDTLAPDNKGVAAFQFYGELNTYAPWADGDISVTGAYTITPLRSSTYENYLEDEAFTLGGWGTQLKTLERDFITPQFGEEDEPATEPETENQTENQTETEPETEPQTEPETEAQTEPQTEPETEPQTEPSEPATEPMTQPQTLPFG